MRAQFPDKAAILFEPARYKVLHGGRGSGKSHSCAKALLLHGVQDKERVLCAREIQKSIKDSVHRLLSDQISVLGLDDFYEVLETEIRGRNGTQIFFTGLSNQTIDSVKSFEGVSICWVEEAQSVSRRSWDILIPTIRAPNSEIWITMNPALDTDPTYERFISNPPPDSKVVQMNYLDNPWFPNVLEQERVHYEATQDPVYYRRTTCRRYC
jgi:phage terminase large subunit